MKGMWTSTLFSMYVYYYRTYEKAVSGGGEREKGGHVLRDTTSRGLYVRVWPPHAVPVTDSSFFLILIFLKQNKNKMHEPNDAGKTKGTKPRELYTANSARIVLGATTPAQA